VITHTDVCAQLMQNAIGIIEHDTVPGIVAIANAANAERIIALKNRDAHKGFIVLIPTIQAAYTLARTILPATEAIMHRYWPGPLTVIVEKAPTVPDSISGYRPTIALRCPHHPKLQAILGDVNQPLLSTSANISGHTGLSQALLDRVDFTYGNVTLPADGQPSTLLDGTQSPPILIRQGALQMDQSVIGRFNSPDT
jgi:L-threonylcarbamoyladenylate synthase